MAKTYIVARGDTLTKIARAQLGDPALAKVIADFNGLPDASQIFVGQAIQLPSARDLRPAVAALAPADRRRAPPPPGRPRRWASRPCATCSATCSPMCATTAA